MYLKEIIGLPVASVKYITSITTLCTFTHLLWGLASPEPHKYEFEKNSEHLGLSTGELAASPGLSVSPGLF